MSSPSGKIGLYRILQLVFIGVLVAAIALFVVFGLPLVVPQVKGAGTFPVVRELIGLERQLSAPIRKVLPPGLQRRNLVNWLLLAAMAVLALEANNRRNRLRKRIEALRQFEAFSAARRLPGETQPPAAPPPKPAPALPKPDHIPEGATPGERDELLRVFAETKKKLDAMGRDLAFLAVDVVDSTGMKVGEEQGIVERDFREYKKLVESKIKVSGALKSAWTPDGVMICLPSVDLAVRLGQDLITGLDGFNKHVKCMKRDFRIRCGINFGYVYYDPAVPMEEMSDRVIDVAGHMQKYAAPNSIAIAKQAIEPVRSRDGFVTAGRIVDGYEVFIWPEGTAADAQAPDTRRTP